MHALTKYPSGGGDVLMGSVTTRDDALHLRLKVTHMRMGWGVGVNDAELVLRALPSLPLRYAAHDATGRTLAHWWPAASEIVQVLHPALPESPGPRPLAAALQRRRPACSRCVFDAGATPRRRSMPSSTRCGSSRSAIRGPGR